MRTALLLLLLALAAIPGSVIPQTSVDPFAVTRWQTQHPGLTPLYDKLGLFSVYRSVWFSAIYLLLMPSLVGCVLPRLKAYWRAMRARPPRTPRNLSRLPGHREVRLDVTPEVALQAAAAELRRRFRIDVHPDSVAGERGYLREADNLVIHTSVLVVLLAFAYAKMFGFVGAVIVVTGDSFSNSVSQYDTFVPGSLFNPDRLAPFSFKVDDFHVRFLPDGPQAGQPVSFAADLAYRADLDAPERQYKLRATTR
ncbi:MAG: cytochrome c biogenesis protein ResB [Acidimicrobiales bacterium]